MPTSQLPNVTIEEHEIPEEDRPKPPPEHPNASHEVFKGDMPTIKAPKKKISDKQREHLDRIRAKSVASRKAKKEEAPVSQAPREEIRSTPDPVRR